jgi:hypothetical protein
MSAVSAAGEDISSEMENSKQNFCNGKNCCLIAAGLIPRSLLRSGEFLQSLSRMHLAGIQANSDWTPDKNIRG